MHRPTKELTHLDTRQYHTQEPTTLFMVANRDIYADGLARVMAGQPDLDVISCNRPTHCHSRYAERPTEILMIEQSVILKVLEDTSPDQLFKPFMEIRPDLRIIVFGHEMPDSFVRRMLQAGAHGFIDSSTGPELLGIAIHEVRDGGYWLGRKSLQHLVQSISEIDRIVEQGIADKIARMKNTLTKRETDVLQRVLGGMSTREMAEDLCLSEQSIKLHLGHLFRKFEVSNRSQLILMAFKRVCPVSNMIQLFRRTLDRHHLAHGRPAVIDDPLARMS